MSMSLYNVTSRQKPQWCWIHIKTWTLRSHENCLRSSYSLDPYIRSQCCRQLCIRERPLEAQHSPQFEHQLDLSLAAVLNWWSCESAFMIVTWKVIQVESQERGYRVSKRFDPLCNKRSQRLNIAWTLWLYWADIFPPPNMLAWLSNIPTYNSLL